LNAAVVEECKLTLYLINVLSFRIETHQYRTFNESIYAVHQSFSGFYTGELGRPHSAHFGPPVKCGFADLRTCGFSNV